MGFFSQILDKLGIHKTAEAHVDDRDRLGRGDSAQMNMWLHKTVLAKIAANGGNIPKELLS